MSQAPRPHAPAALARFFEALVATGEASALCLPGGATLFEAGEVSDQLFFLRSGRLAARLGEPERKVVPIAPGETVGEMALLAGEAHSATVFALRDSELIAAPRDLFFERSRTDPDLMLALARLILGRTRETQRSAAPRPRRVFAVCGLSPGVSARGMAADLAAALGRLGQSASAPTAGGGAPEWFARTEARHDFVLYPVEHHERDWRAMVARQVDGVLFLARGDERPAEGPPGERKGPWPETGDLVLVQAPDARAPVGAAAWQGALAPERLFHLREGRKEDMDRLARTLAGRAIGLVLSGGAARAYAHVGVVQVLRESGAPIDFVGGVSMGAVVSAGIAMGWDDGELDDRIRQAFVSSSPLHDLTLPLIAMTKGEVVRERLAAHFGERAIEDLWLPFFSGSTNLTTGAFKIHRRGLLREALRASLSLPGVLPPVADGDDVLVDGAVLNNFPTDIMRSLHDGPIVGVDVSHGRSLGAADIAGPPSPIQWLSSGAWREGAPIVSILIRAATVSASQQAAAAHELADLLILPKVDDIEIGDWRAYEPAVAAGRRAALEALDTFGRKVGELTRGPPRNGHTRLPQVAGVGPLT